MKTQQSTAVTKESDGPKKVSRSGDIVDGVYKKVSALIIEFDIKPGERINEVKLSKFLNVSRTSLREAMNRLFATGMLDFKPNKGFFVKEFDVDEILQLLEARLLIECGVTRLVIEKASNEQLRELREYWESVMESYTDKDPETLVTADAEFHERMARITQNRVIENQLSWINKRIQFVRWARLKGTQRLETFMDHFNILDALEARDVERSISLIREHIDHRSRDIERAMADGLLYIYRKKSIDMG